MKWYDYNKVIKNIKTPYQPLQQPGTSDTEIYIKAQKLNQIKLVWNNVKSA